MRFVSVNFLAFCLFFADPLCCLYAVGRLVPVTVKFCMKDPLSSNCEVLCEGFLILCILNITMIYKLYYLCSKLFKVHGSLISGCACLFFADPLCCLYAVGRLVPVTVKFCMKDPLSSNCEVLCEGFLILCILNITMINKLYYLCSKLFKVHGSLISGCAFEVFANCYHWFGQFE